MTVSESGGSNRRRHPRYRPNADSPVRVRLLARLTATRSLLTEARLLDLSLGGLGLLVLRPLASELNAETPLDLRLEIGEGGSSVTLPARLRYCRPTGGAWRCGLEFDVAHDDFVIGRGPLLEYLAGCSQAAA